MEIKYIVEGKERKRLAETIAAATGAAVIYKGAPTFAYEIDYFTVDRNGTLSFDDMADSEEVETVIDALDEVGFEFVEPEEPSGLAIQMPMMTGDEISRLEALIESKASLIRKAIGVENLTVGEKDGKLDFPWFRSDAEPDDVRAYMTLVTALCRTAKESKRITAKDKPVENEKYAFRCFLLKLGLIGDEYKTDRKILLRNFSGNSAWKGGVPNENTK